MAPNPFFGKLFLHEEKEVYWTKVHNVMRKGTLTGVQGETSKRTRVGVAPQLTNTSISVYVWQRLAMNKS